MVKSIQELLRSAHLSPDATPTRQRTCQERALASEPHGTCRSIDSEDEVEDDGIFASEIRPRTVDLGGEKAAGDHCNRVIDVRHQVVPISRLILQ